MRWIGRLHMPSAESTTTTLHIKVLLKMIHASSFAMRSLQDANRLKVCKKGIGESASIVVGRFRGKTRVLANLSSCEHIYAEVLYYQTPSSFASWTPRVQSPSPALYIRR